MHHPFFFAGTNEKAVQWDRNPILITNGKNVNEKRQKYSFDKKFLRSLPVNLYYSGELDDKILSFGAYGKKRKELEGKQIFKKELLLNEV